MRPTTTQKGFWWGRFGQTAVSSGLLARRLPCGGTGLLLGLHLPHQLRELRLRQLLQPARRAVVSRRAAMQRRGTQQTDWGGLRAASASQPPRRHPAASRTSCPCSPHAAHSSASRPAGNGDARLSVCAARLSAAGRGRWAAAAARHEAEDEDELHDVARPLLLHAGGDEPVVAPKASGEDARADEQDVLPGVAERNLRAGGARAVGGAREKGRAPTKPGCSTRLPKLGRLVTQRKY